MNYDHLESCAHEIRCIAAELEGVREYDAADRMTSLIISYLEEITEMLESSDE